MKATNTAYSFSDSLSRIDEILNALIQITKRRIRYPQQALPTIMVTMWNVQQYLLISVIVVI